MASDFSTNNWGFIEYYNSISTEYKLNLKCTSIINCSLDPKIRDGDFIKKLIESGMSTAIIDFRNTNWTIEEGRNLVKLIRKQIMKMSAENKYYIPIPIAMSLRGSQVFCGHFLNEDQEINVSSGDIIYLTSLRKYKFQGTYYPVIYISYSLSEHIKKGTRIVFDYGALVLSVLGIISVDEPHLKDEKAIKCISLNNTILSDYAMIYLSTEEELLKGTLQREDKEILQLCSELEIDSIIIPTLRQRTTITLIKDALASLNTSYRPLFIAHICDMFAINHITEILDYVDGVTLSRDSAMKYSDEGGIPFMQKFLTSNCINYSKFFFITDPLPDLNLQLFTNQDIPFINATHYVLEGIDGVIIDEDFVNSATSLKHIKSLKDFFGVAECYNWQKYNFEEILLSDIQNPSNLSVALTISTITLCLNIGAKAIFVLTVSGKSAKIFYKYRPPFDIIAITRSKSVGRKLSYYKGITPLIFEPTGLENWCEDVDTRFKSAIKWAKDYKGFVAGDLVILQSGWLPGSGHTNRIRILTIS